MKLLAPTLIYAQGLMLSQVLNLYGLQTGRDGKKQKTNYKKHSSQSPVFTIYLHLEVSSVT